MLAGLLHYRPAECLKRILAIAPQHPEAAKLLHDLGKSPPR
jgi:hypothetical protein